MDAVPKLAPRALSESAIKTLPQVSLAQPAQGPQAVFDHAVAGLRMLLQVEADMRRVKSLDELTVLCVNEIAKSVRARQIFYADLSKSKARLRYATGLVSLDANAPTVRWVQDALVGALKGKQTARTQFEIQPEPGLGQAMAHPFPYALWLPLARRNEVAFGGLLALRESPWGDGDILLAERLTDTAAHAATTLRVRPKPRGRLRWKLPLALMLGLLVSFALAWPVPMTALAPLEIAAVDAFVIAAPIDGIIEAIDIPQNTRVKEGDLLLRYVDTVPRNQLQVAEREVQVAQAKLAQSLQTSFEDDKAKREIGQFRAELTTKIAERDFARDTFEKTRIRAPRAGIAVFEDAKDWLGKPVVAGTRIMEIVDLDRVEARIDLAVADGMVAGTGGRARLFLDADPVHPLEAAVTGASHHARPGEGGVLAYRLIARLAPGSSTPRLGMRGTAQIFAQDVPLGFYLMRRPLSWLRQKVGI